MLTRDDPKATSYYVDLSRVEGPYTCVHYGTPLNSAGHDGDIFVTVRCSNLWHPCPLFYNIEIACDMVPVIEYEADNRQGRDADL